MDALNNRRQQVINPSHMIVEDELMSTWISKEQDWKPKGVVTEIKCITDYLQCSWDYTAPGDTCM